MFPGPSRQTPREPDLGNPYRVDLGTAMFGKFDWSGRATQKHDDNARYDTHAGHDAHAKHDAHADKDIAAMEAEHEKSIAAHTIAEQNVKKNACF